MLLFPPFKLYSAKDSSLVKLPYTKKTKPHTQMTQELETTLTANMLFSKIFKELGIFFRNLSRFWNTCFFMI